ncbi:hypothetical protein ACH9EU_16585 [Kocuria sp. M1R5S2]|uniref:hypothetical protein n=1 Tax=Kocuria rhizosphaerae TaxID=3376285 RepID=UPI0037BB4366
MNDLPAAGALPDPGVPTVVDLAAGSAHITPVPVAGVARYALDLPTAPLTDGDLQDLTIALHGVHSGAAILVDVDEYAGGSRQLDDYAGTE